MEDNADKSTYVPNYTPSKGDSLQDKIAIITGSSTGLGRAIATAYAAQGAFVVCADLQPTP